MELDGIFLIILNLERNQLCFNEVNVNFLDL